MNMLFEKSTYDYYTIHHICLFTGFTDRTVRNYISSGILKGKKINGMWHFTPEQVDEFLSNPAVRPSLTAKRNGYVYDFIFNSFRDRHRTCMILDFPGEDEKGIAEYFCNCISTEDYHDINFSFDGAADVPRVILRGDTGEVLRLINGFYDRH